MERRLSAILYADVAGYSRLVGADEEGTHRIFRAHFDALNATIEAQGGRIVHTAGDAVLAEFSSVVWALNAAVLAQREMARHNESVPDVRKLQFRIGVNVGDVIIDGDEIYGTGVNVAARLEALAEPGGICVSGRVVDQVEKNVDVGFASLGPQVVKNIDKPVDAHKVLLDPADAGKIFAGPKPHSPQRAGWVAATVALALVIGVGAAAWLYLNKPEVKPAATHIAPLPLPDKPSVAVLPFTNLSADQSQEYFADGLTDDLILDLSKVSGLFVIARNSVFTFKGKPVRIKEVAEDLGVGYVVEGSIRRDGDRVRVNAQLVDGATGRHVWSERYDREITDIFAMQDELVSEIVSALAVQLTGIEMTQLAGRPAPEFEAYDLYLQARDSYFSGDAARMRDSLDLYERAWTIDPTFARAYAGYARTAADILRLAFSRVMSVPLARKAAEDAASKALALDPAQPDAHSVLALLKLADGDRDAAVRFARRAVELDPNNADAQATLAIVLGYAGEPEAALVAIRTAVRLNPRPPPYFWTYYGWALFLNRDYDDAIAVLEPVAESPGQAVADSPREILAMAYAESGRVDEARAQVDALRERDPWINLAYYRQRYGLQARAQDVHRRLDALRTAGLPEWPLGFRGEAKNRLKGRALHDLISRKTWSGSDATRRLPFVEEFGEDGDVVYAAAATLMIGTATVDNDELCERFDLFLLGQEGCGPVYRNPDGTSEDRNEYIYVNPTTVRHFSLAE